MEILPISEINVDTSKIQSIKETVESTFRLITFSRKHLADDLLNTNLRSTTNLQRHLSMKNTQMEAQNEDEVELFLNELTKTMTVITEEIKHSIDFSTEVKLFQLFRSVSPESYLYQPYRYRDKFVQSVNIFVQNLIRYLRLYHRFFT